MNKTNPLTPTEFGQASVLAAELLEGITYPPHSIRLLARAYLDLLKLLDDHMRTQVRLATLPTPVTLPERTRAELAKVSPCQHGVRPAHDGRTTCLPCVWMAEGHLDAAFRVCEHDQRVGSCRHCQEG